MGLRQKITGKRFLRRLKRERQVRPKNVPIEIAETRVTSAKRLAHIDKFLIRVGKFDKSKPVKFLDVGCCPMLDGAPTTMTTNELFKKAGYSVDMTAVDKYLPEKFNPTDKSTNYKSLDISTHAPRGKFDIVRASNVFQYIKGKESVMRAKEHVFNAVGEKGFLIIDASGKVVSEFGHHARSAAGFLILQKVDGKMVFVKYVDPQSFYRSRRAGYV